LQKEGEGGKKLKRKEGQTDDKKKSKILNDQCLVRKWEAKNKKRGGALRYRGQEKRRAMEGGKSMFGRNPAFPKGHRSAAGSKEESDWK